jgi:hypothetical protein
MHDRAPQLAGQVAAVNGILERTDKSLGWERLNHVRVATVEQPQWYQDEYRARWLSAQYHPGIGDQTRAENPGSGPASARLFPGVCWASASVFRPFRHRRPTSMIGDLYFA